MPGATCVGIGLTHDDSKREQHELDSEQVNVGSYRYLTLGPIQGAFLFTGVLKVTDHLSPLG